MKTIILDEVEEQQLIELIDVAVKAIGLRASQAALNIVTKLQQAPAVEASDPPEEK